MVQRPRLFLLWSCHHDKWWSTESMGYTTKVGQAGLYSEEEAGEICERSAVGWHAAGRQPTIAIEIANILLLPGLQADAGAIAAMIDLEKGRQVPARKLQ